MFSFRQQGKDNTSVFHFRQQEKDNTSIFRFKQWSITRYTLLLLCLTILLIPFYAMSASANETKAIAILGDSYSAYYGYIPKGYSCSYAIHGKDGVNKWPNNVNSVKQMWWHKLIATGRYRLSVNCSYSGSCFGYVAKGGKKRNQDSYITRMKKFLNGQKRQADIIFVQGGANDSWRKRPIGELKFNAWTQKDLRKALPAFCYILDYLKAHNPSARIVVLINNKYTRSALLEGMKSACAHYEIPYLFLGRISTQSRHPSRQGQDQIYQTVLQYLED